MRATSRAEASEAETGGEPTGLRRTDFDRRGRSARVLRLVRPGPSGTSPSPAPQALRSSGPARAGSPLAAASPLARGIETFILDTTNDESAKKLAANENRVSLDALDQFQKDPLLFTLFQKAKADESYDLARVVHKFIIEGTRKDFNDVFDHGVKEGPFFVLMGATMPCVLIETSFISNPEEEKRLQSDDYLDALADSIAEGLAEYSRRRRSGQVHDL